MRKLRHGHYILYRIEERDRVWLYGYFQWHELKKRLKEGWEVWR